MNGTDLCSWLASLSTSYSRDVGREFRPAAPTADLVSSGIAENMNTKTGDGDKRTAGSALARDVALIDEQTIRRLEDDDGDRSGCRFAAVARSLEEVSVPNTRFDLPVTRVAYVDESGRYGIEREFFGHREDWQRIPRTVVVPADSYDVVRELPRSHRDRYRPILDAYERVLEEER